MDKHELQSVIKRLILIAYEYAELLYDYGGSVYSGIELNNRNSSFSFVVGPTTSGMNRRVWLPLDILWNNSISLQELANKQRQKWEEALRKAKCGCCGHIKEDYLLGL